MLISLVDQLAAAYEHDEQRRKLFTKGRDIFMKEKDCFTKGVQKGGGYEGSPLS